MSNNTSIKTLRRDARRRRIRAKISGTGTIPRLSVFRSNTRIVVQLIDDTKAVTLAMASSDAEKGKTQSERAVNLGKTIAKIAKEKKIDTVVFDRGGYQYIGNIQLLADAAREAGLKF